MKTLQTILGLVGETPLVRLEKIVPEGSAEVWAKLESVNPGGSLKDRIALSMVEEAERNGLLTKNKTIIEPTSGNTGIGLALVAASKGYKVMLAMPETMSVERRRLLELFGAELKLTPGADGMTGAVSEAARISEDSSKYYMPSQFDNPANPKAHYETTGPEIWEQTDGVIDAFVSGVGTGGTITGVARFLKEKGSKAMIVAIEPAQSPVLSGGKSGPHKIQGIGAGFVPKVLDMSLVDEIIQVDDSLAISSRRRLALEEGISAGISSGAAIAASIKIAKKLGSGKRIVTVLPDTGERYLSMLI